MSEPMQEPEGCTRWGNGKDRCIRHYDHIGECRDAEGNTTTSLADWLLGRRKQPEFD